MKAALVSAVTLPLEGVECLAAVELLLPAHARTRHWRENFVRFA